MKIAVYGTLLKGEHNEHWREGVKSLGYGTVEGLLYDTGFGFPAIKPMAGEHKVKVEVLDATDEEVKRMDRLEGYPRLYYRARVDCVLDSGEKIKVMVYVLNYLKDNAVCIGSGDWVQYRKNTLEYWRKLDVQLYKKACP